MFCTLLKCCWDLRAGGSSISKTRRSRRPARGKRGYPCHDAAIQRNAIKSVGNVETLKTRRGRHGRYAVRDQFVRSLSLYTRAPLLCANKCRDSCPTCMLSRVRNPNLAPENQSWRLRPQCAGTRTRRGPGTGITIRSPPRDTTRQHQQGQGYLVQIFSFFVSRLFFS